MFFPALRNGCDGTKLVGMISEGWVKRLTDPVSFDPNQKPGEHVVILTEVIRREEALRRWPNSERLINLALAQNPAPEKP